MPIILSGRDEYTCSLTELMEGFPQFFYNRPNLNSYFCLHHPVRSVPIAKYIKRFKQNGILMQRQFVSAPETSDLPNIVELTLWWMSYTRLVAGHHGYRTLMTPSSTPEGSTILCVEFVANEFLQIRPGGREVTPIRPN